MSLDTESELFYDDIVHVFYVEASVYAQ